MLAFPAVFPYPHSVDLIESLAAVCREARKKAGKDFLDVAVSYPGKRLEAITFKRFEDGQTGWPKRPEAHVAAYAAATDTNPADLWAEALNRWAQAQAQPDGEDRKPGDTSPRTDSLDNMERELSAMPRSKRQGGAGRQQREG